jgi:hypothetical protein
MSTPAHLAPGSAVLGEGLLEGVEDRRDVGPAAADPAPMPG